MRAIVFASCLGATLVACAHGELLRPSRPAEEARATEVPEAVPSVDREHREHREHRQACFPAPREEVVLAFGGDVIAHEAIRESARTLDRRDPSGRSENHAGYGAMLAAARDAFRGADFAFANVESPVTEHDLRRGEMIFRGEEPILGALSGVGVGVVSLANNHAYDQGSRGLADTIEAARRHGLVTVGVGPTARDACAPELFEVKGVKIALFAQTHYMNFKDDASPPRVCMFALGPLKRAARAARDGGADLVVLSLHWGNEYEATPRREQVDVAHMIVEAGVDLLIGHHPHVLQRVERRPLHGREAIVAYSLGNLLSNQGYGYDARSSREAAGDTRDVAILRVTVTKKAKEGVRIEDVQAVPLWTEHVEGTISLVPATTRRARIAARLDVALADATSDGCNTP